MPQLDVYTFTTQVYFIAFFFFFFLLLTSNFLVGLFFRSELLEKEKKFLRHHKRFCFLEKGYVARLVYRLTALFAGMFDASDSVV